MADAPSRSKPPVDPLNDWTTQAFELLKAQVKEGARLKTLAKSTIDDNARFFSLRDEVPIYAITMGVGTIMESRKILLLANGKLIWSLLQVLADVE